MTSSCTRCKPLRVNLSSEELSALDHDLRFEFGPSAVTPERAEEVRNLLALADKDFEDHVSEMARLEKQRAKLLSLISPMRKLPNEVLLCLFQHVCEENLLQCYPWPFRQKPPTEITSPVITYLPSMAISSVCSRWRELALSSPSLWANLVVETHTLESETSVGFADTVIRYLERSDGLPLRLKLAICGSANATEISSLIHLAQHAWRWKTLKYRGHYSLTGYGMPSEVRFPLLAELDITDSKELGHFEDCLRLRALSTWAVRPIPRVFYGTLEHLDFYGQSLNNVVEALRSCSRLKSLQSRHLQASKDELEQGVLGTWPNIVSLTADRASCRIMFSSLNFPSLNNLVVEGDQISWPSDAFLSFVSRSSCMITAFTLRDIFLEVLPALLHLEVDLVDPYPPPENPITPYFIANLIHDQSTSSIVPELDSLHLKYNSTDTFEDATFIHMVQSRWHKPGSDLSAGIMAMGRSCIRSVVLKFLSREVDAYVYRPLRILDAEGLRVVVAGTNGVQSIYSRVQQGSVKKEAVKKEKVKKRSMMSSNCIDMKGKDVVTAYIPSLNIERLVITAENASFNRLHPGGVLTGTKWIFYPNRSAYAD
ncbi:hypothetical protein BDP27DRAFT_1407069 [Rhodocollybia butyracea]|uniref:F-box domain-containing protein n=1 Tax=Rhodocollybia butyracea TaxID=206335 RepID=A0A9P5U0H2_9AGAR|nr:hypothetical protein BDP27DRAFT_1407069 [Rhodocollybia butyracea]